MTSASTVPISCRCGQVLLTASGEPIATTVCSCGSCRDAGEIIARMPGAESVVTDDGTPFVLYRKDHVQCERGAALLAEFRLTTESPTRRVVATCCNSAMFLDFTKGHWLSVFSRRVPISEVLAARKAGYFVPRLVWAWLKMGFRNPKISYVTRHLPESGLSLD